MDIVDILSIIPCAWYWLEYGGFPFLLLKNCNIDPCHFTKRILEIVPLGKKEQWCDKVTMYSRERVAGARCHKVGLSRLAKGTLIQIKDTSIFSKMHREILLLPLFLEQCNQAQPDCSSIPRHTASGANCLK
jgi:hypothetical protein